MANAAGRQKTAIVIGAGVGGVATAARLAKAGFKVTVLEKNSYSGGRCSLLHHEGWRFDQGPSLLLLPELFRQTFRDLGTTLEAEGVQLLKCDPNYNIWFGDGEQFELSTDVAAMKHEIEKWEGKAGFERYLAFLQEAHAHYELSVTHVLMRNFTSILSMMRPSFLRHVLPLHPFESIYSRASRYFSTERLRRVFTFGSMYMGMSPFDAPGTYSLLQYAELAEGIWYPVGGFHKVIEALVKIGERTGVEFRFSTSVSKILMSDDGSSAQGVLLETGERLTSDVVINNSDLVYAYKNLLPETPYAKSLAKREASCSSISFYWALDSKVDKLETHNIFLADDYKESFDSIFKQHLIPDQPSFYVNIPSRVDPSAAPLGKDAMVILVPVGHLLAPSDAPADAVRASASDSGLGQKGSLAPTRDQDWPAMRALARKTVLSTMQARTGIDIGALIVHEQTNDPMSWRSEFNLDQGAILGLSHSFFNVLSFRPATRARRGDGWLDMSGFGLAGGILGRIAEVLFAGGHIKGLYMVGASAHPGTGVPICLAGARLVAEQVCEDLSVTLPWRNAWSEGDERMNGAAGTTGKALDTIDNRSWLTWRNCAFVVGLLAFLITFFRPFYV